MGIFGLTGFIDKNTYLLHRHELRGCPVVIDGNNLLHHIYRACSIPCLFGGDYDIYRQQVVTNFKSLLKCGITPYVVMDGGYTTDNRKLVKCVDRAKQRIRNASLAASKGVCSLTPLLAYDTFVQAMNEVGVQHVTCQFEADEEIAKVANKLRCPVVSADSDFYIFDLSHGFLPLDYIDFNPLYKKYEDGTKSPPYLHCHIYHVQDFIDSFDGLSRSVLPVFATLLGNDFVPPDTVRHVFAKVQVPKIVSRKFNAPTKLSTVIKLLHWLEMHSSDSDSSSVLDTILPYLHSKKKFLNSVNSYKNIDHFKGCDLVQYFLHHNNFVPQAAPTFTAYNGAQFPDWFLNAICHGNVSPAIINAMVLHRIIFLCQVENLKLATIHECSASIRNVIYGIVMASDPVHRIPDLKPAAKHDSDFMSEVVQAIIQSAGHLAKTDLSNELGAVAHSDAHRTKGMTEAGDEKGFTGNVCAGRSELMSVSGVNGGDENVPIEGNASVLEDDGQGAVSGTEGGEVVVKEEQSGTEDKKQDHVEEYHRYHRSLKKTFVKPAASEISLRYFPSLNEIGGMSVQHRLEVILQLLSIPVVICDTFSVDIVLYVISLIIWLRQAQPRLTELHLDCAILCPILLHMRAPTGGSSQKKKVKLAQSTESPQSDNPEKRICCCSSDTLQTDEECMMNLGKLCEAAKRNDKDKFKEAENQLEKYRTGKPTFGRRGTHFDVDTVHSFSQLQSCMHEVSNLNKILQSPLPNLKPARLINGSFLYNFYTDLTSRQSPHSFIEAMLLVGSDLNNVFKQFKGLVLDVVTSSCFKPLEDDLIKRRKKNKGNRRKRKSTADNDESKVEMDCCTEDKAMDSDEGVITIQGFDVNNKFALLHL